MKYLLILLFLLCGCEQTPTYVIGEEVYDTRTKQTGILMEITYEEGGIQNISYAKIKFKYIQDDGTETTRIDKTYLANIRHINLEKK